MIQLVKLIALVLFASNLFLAVGASATVQSNNANIIAAVIAWVLLVGQWFLWRRIIGSMRYRRDVRRAQYWQTVHSDARRRRGR